MYWVMDCLTWMELKLWAELSSHTSELEVNMNHKKEKLPNVLPENVLMPEPIAHVLEFEVLLLQGTTSLHITPTYTNKKLI
jgi:hypothetical protein